MSSQLILETITPELQEATEQKFKEWDIIVANNVLEKGTPAEQRRVYRLLADPTIYAYAWFKNKEGLPYKLYPYQDLIINDQHKRIIFVAANQIGKSVTLCIKAVHFALHNPGKTVLMVSKTLPQAKDLLRKIKELLNSSVLDYKYDIGDTDNKTEIYFKHLQEVSGVDPFTKQPFTTVKELAQSRIICVPATEAALGYDVDLLLLDELAFFADGEYFYRQIAQPRTYHTKGQIIAFSNPNGKKGIFWELWNDEWFHAYRFNFLSCPKNTLEEYERYSKKLTRFEIDSTLDAVFTDAEGSFLTLAEREAMQEDRENFLPLPVTKPVYIFFDFAKVHDRTVRGIGVETPTGGVHVYELFQYPEGTPYDQIIDDLVALVSTLGTQNVAMVGWDNTGVGSGIEDFIRRIEAYGVPCMPVSFNIENKSRIYTHFKLLIERNLRSPEQKNGIKIPRIPDCDRQLANLVFKTSGRGYWQVHHENESDHDDYPDCLAGLCSLIIKPEEVPVSIVVVEGDYKRECETCHATVPEESEQCLECGAEYFDWLGVV